MKKNKTPTFLLELPLTVDSGQAKRLRAHFEAARGLPQSQKRERVATFSQLRHEYGFSEYSLHAFAKDANRVCIGKAKKVRFRSKGRGLDSGENKWEKSGLRFAFSLSRKAIRAGLYGAMTV